MLEFERLDWSVLRKNTILHGRKEKFMVLSGIILQPILEIHWCKG